MAKSQLNLSAATAARWPSGFVSAQPISASHAIDRREATKCLPVPEKWGRPAHLISTILPTGTSMHLDADCVVIMQSLNLLRARKNQTRQRRCRLSLLEVTSEDTKDEVK